MFRSWLVPGQSRFRWKSFPQSCLSSIRSFHADFGISSPTKVTETIAPKVPLSASEQKLRLTTLRLYRILQRASRSFPTRNEERIILLQPLLQPDNWGRYVIFKPPSPTSIEELFRLFYVWNDVGDDIAPASKSASQGDPSIDDWYYSVVGTENGEDQLPPMTSMTCWTSASQIQDAVRSVFRNSALRDEKAMTQKDIKDSHYWAIRAAQILHEQAFMWRNSSVATTNGIRVTATSRCIGTTSPTVVSAVSQADMTAMLETRHRFAYRIRVENTSEHTVQLLGRYWCIEELTSDGQEDDTKEKVQVDSPATGAVGQLPVLRPGQVFEYMSGTDLVSTKGRMTGHFYMTHVPHDRISAKAGDHVEALGVSGDEKFEVSVAPFPLEAGS